MTKQPHTAQDTRVMSPVARKTAPEIRRAQVNIADMLLEAGAREDEIRDMLAHLGVYSRTGLEVYDGDGNRLNIAPHAEDAK